MLLGEGWTVDYGRGPQPCEIPHAWRQEVPVMWEGPAIYRNRCRVPENAKWLQFEGVSYEAEVLIDGRHRLTHRGIWDAFECPVEDLVGHEIDLEVRVVKNGGDSFPVRDVLSGFLPYVFNTFGGIFRPVQFLSAIPDTRAPLTTAEVRGSQIWVDGRPVYVRGVVHWGWYPELGHPHPARQAIEKEVAACKGLAFNLVKFCLWVPPHEYLEVLAENGMWGWMELPLWDPSPDPGKLADMAIEIERIVEQYRHHPNILLWTAGCELSHATPPEYREGLVQMIKAKTGSPLVRDNSGGAEMYGGGLREYGDFWDFHPYCETPYYPEVLDSLAPGPRPNTPVLLGEFNDIDVHRDFGLLQREKPYWLSQDPDLNHVGVRWQHDFPDLMPSHPMLQDTNLELMRSTVAKAAFMREFVQQEVRARDWIGGYVVTGIRDTPISTSGVFDDQGEARFAGMMAWNAPNVLFRIPSRRPPWVRGGNRPGWLDVANFWEDECHLRIGLSSEQGFEGTVEWRLESAIRTVEEGSVQAAVPALKSSQVLEISPAIVPGEYRLRVRAGTCEADWPFDVWEKTDWPSPEEFRASVADMPDPWSFGRLTVFRSGKLVRPMPFWREAAYDYPVPSPMVDLIRDQWHRLIAISGDVAFDEEAVRESLVDFEVLMRRIDTRSYRTNPVVIRHAGGIWTTLRPFGGLGRQPHGLSTNPFGATLAWLWGSESG